MTNHLQTYGTFSGNSDKGDIDSSEDENSEGSTKEQYDADLPSAISVPLFSSQSDHDNSVSLCIEMFDLYVLVSIN